MRTIEETVDRKLHENDGANVLYYETVVSYRGGADRDFPETITVSYGLLDGTQRNPLDSKPIPVDSPTEGLQSINLNGSLGRVFIEVVGEVSEQEARKIVDARSLGKDRLTKENLRERLKLAGANQRAIDKIEKQVAAGKFHFG